MKSSPTSPESEVNLKQSLKNFKKEFQEHKETLLKLKEERVSLVIEVAELKQTIKDIQESTKICKEKAKESPRKSPKDIFSVVKSLAKALSVSKNTNNEASNTENPPAERPSTVVISHKYTNETETWTSSSKTKRKFSSPLSSSELSSSTSTIPTEKKSPPRTKIAFVTKGVVRKKKKKLSYSWYRDKKKVLEKIGNLDESKIKKSDGLHESQ